MTRLTSREQKLLLWQECSVRGLSPKYVDAPDNEETQESPLVSSEMTEEDYLFPVDPPVFLLELSHSLTLFSKSPLNDITEEFVYRTKVAKVMEAITSLRDFLFCHPKYTRLQSRLLSDPLLLNHQALSLNLFLDYLPLLRSMAVQERISDYMFKIQEASNSDDASALMKNHGRRVTRRSKTRGREQYFDKLFPPYAFETSNKTANGIVELLANMSLLYTKANKQA